MLQILLLLATLTAILLALVIGAQSLHFTALRRLIGERDEPAARAAANRCLNNRAEANIRSLRIYLYTARSRNAEMATIIDL